MKHLLQNSHFWLISMVFNDLCDIQWKSWKIIRFHGKWCYLSSEILNMDHNHLQIHQNRLSISPWTIVNTYEPSHAIFSDFRFFQVRPPPAPVYHWHHMNQFIFTDFWVFWGYFRGKMHYMSMLQRMTSFSKLGFWQNVKGPRGDPKKKKKRSYKKNNFPLRG